MERTPENNEVHVQRRRHLLASRARARGWAAGERDQRIDARAARTCGLLALLLAACDGPASTPVSERLPTQTEAKGDADEMVDRADGGQASRAGAGDRVQSLRDVLLVGNAVSGTISFLDSHTFENLGSVDVLSDLPEVMEEIEADLLRWVAYPFVQEGQALRQFEPADGARFVDDVFVSPEGTALFVSRAQLGDVAAFDLTRAGHPLLWRSFVDGVQANHAALSPDGSRIVVSAVGPAQVANVIDARSGEIVGSFPTGTGPHQNDYSADGKHIYNSSVGLPTPLVSAADNALKGDRWLVKADADTLEVRQIWVFAYGIRPNVITPDEQTMYAQLSFLNGLIKYDLTTGREVARSEQPLNDFAREAYPTLEDYPHDSAHHGLALSGDGAWLCDCGTIANTVSIVSSADLAVKSTLDVGMIPYWATTSADGRVCFVSLSGDDAVSAIDYESGQLLSTIPVGKFPQRTRLGKLPERVLELLHK